MESAKYDEQDAQILAISCNSRFSLNKFAESLNDPDFPLLADFWPHGAVGEAYGVFNAERGLNGRSIFIVDRDGVIQYAKQYEPGTLPENEELLAELASSSAASPTSHNQAGRAPCAIVEARPVLGHEDADAEGATR